MKTQVFLEKIDEIDYEAEKLGVHMEAKKKFCDGAEKYGEYVPEYDTRDFFNEMREELLDTRNYLDMLIIKIDGIKRKYHGVARDDDVHPPRTATGGALPPLL